MAAVSRKSVWWANEVLNCLKGTAPTIPAANSFYVALFSADPGAGTGTGVPLTNEFANGTSAGQWSGYARQQVSLGTVSGGSVTDAATAINFPANASAGSVTVVGWALMDSATPGAGNAYYTGTFASSQTVANGQPFQIPASQITINEA